MRLGSGELQDAFHGFRAVAGGLLDMRQALSLLRIIDVAQHQLRVAEDAAVADLAGRTLGVVPGDRAMAPLRPGLAASDVRHALRAAFRRGVEAGLGPS